jgi:hypothetical protein
VFVGALALLAPGLEGWDASREVLAGRCPFVASTPFAPPSPPSPPSLPPAERRRTTVAIRLAVAAADASLLASGLKDAATDLASVFASSNGDGAVIDAILKALASPERAVSPTQFHNSVHNAPPAYWAIGARAMGSSTSFGCWDDSFAAGLLHAAAKASARPEPVLLCVYDAPLPPPLSAVRRTEFPFATAMVLTPGPAPFAIAELEVRFEAGRCGPETSEPRLAALRPLYQGNPAARALRLLEILARREAAAVATLPYLGDSHLALGIEPC